MARKTRSEPEPAQNGDALAASIDRLSGELHMLGDVLDEIRQDFSWLTNNGLPVQPIEHVVVHRMALDPGAPDWGERLAMTRSRLENDPSVSPLDSDRLDRIVDDLNRTFEAVAEGQLDAVLDALNEVRCEIEAALDRRFHPPSATRVGRSRSPVEADRRPEPIEQETEPPEPGHLF